MRERDILDALHRRFCTVDQFNSRRYVVAEHVGLEPLFPRRVLDFVAFDTWGSTGYALNGFEVKVSRSDLMRELRHPEKAAMFTDHVDHFTLVLAHDVTWKDLVIPENFGVMVCSESGRLRSVRKPVRLTTAVGYQDAAPLQRSVMAGFIRAANKTAIRVCARHDISPTGHESVGSSAHP